MKIYLNGKSDIVNQVQDNMILNFPRIQFVVSERCSLKCEKCTHLMQYYEKPSNVNLERAKVAFNKLLYVTGNISELRILGGEPFMNPELYKIIRWWHDSDKIEEFTVYTNGTIIPGSECIEELARKKVRVRISDYLINRERIGALTETLDNYDIQYYISEYEAWGDAGDLNRRGRSEIVNKQIFDKCFERNCITFLHGKLYRCPRSAHAMNLGAMPDMKDDYVDLEEWIGGSKDLILRIKSLQNKELISACDYCDGPSTHEFNIPAAKQVKNPLKYRKYFTDT